MKNLTDFPFHFCPPRQVETRIERWASITYVVIRSRPGQIQEEDRWAFANFVLLQQNCKSVLAEGPFSFEMKEILLVQPHIFEGLHIRC